MNHQANLLARTTNERNTAELRVVELEAALSKRSAGDRSEVLATVKHADEGGECATCKTPLGRRYFSDVPKQGTLCLTCHKIWSDCLDPNNPTQEPS